MKVNYSGENRNKEFLQNYPKVPAYPHFFVLDSDGTLLHSQGTAKLEEGRSYNEEVFLEFLTRWKPSGSKDEEASSVNSAKEEPMDAEEVPSTGFESARAEKKLVQKSAPASHSADDANEAKLLQLGDRRLRHRGLVRLVRYSPDGKMIASSGTNHDTGIHLWDSATGRHVRHLNRDLRWGWVQDFAFSPDGRHLVGAWIDQALTLWDVATGEIVWEFAGEEAQAAAVAFHPGGKSVVVGSRSGAITLRLVRDGQIGPELVAGAKRAEAGASYGEGGPAAVFAFAPDGSWLVCGQSSSIKIFDLARNELRTVIPSPHGTGKGFLSGALVWIAVTPDGQRLVSTGYRYVPRDQLKGTYTTKNVNISEIKLWDIRSGKQLVELTGEAIGVGFGRAGLAPDGRTLALSTNDGLRLWDLVTQRMIRQIEVTGLSLQSPVFSPHDEQLAAGAGSGAAVWDLESGKRLLHDPRTHEGFVAETAYSPDGGTMATASGGTVHVWDAQTGALRFRRHLDGRSYVYDLLFTPDSGQLIAAGKRDDVASPGGAIVFWDADTGALLKTLLTGEGETYGGDARHIAVSPDGQRLAVAEFHSNQSKIQLWDISTGKKIAAYPPNQGGEGLVWEVDDLQFTADGRYLWSASKDSQICRWDTKGDDHFQFVAEWRHEFERALHKSPHVFQATFTHDARYVLTVPITKVLHVWDLATGKLQSTLPLPGVQKGARFAVAPDHSTIAVTDVIYAGDPGVDVVTIWDLGSQELVQRLEPGGARALSMAFSPDSKRLVTGLDRGFSLVWELK